MPDQTITTVSQRPPNEQAAMDALIAAGTGGPQIPGGRSFFPGDTVAGFSPDQVAAQNRIRGDVSGGLVDQQVQGALQNQMIAQDLGQLLADPLSLPGVRDFRDQTIVDASRQLGEQLLPQMDMGAILSGGFGGPKNQIGRALAADRMNDSTLKNLGQFDMNLFGNLLNANTAALNRAPSIAATGLIPGQTLNDVGAQIQNQNQQEILGDRERHEFGQNEPFFTQDNLRASLGLGQVNTKQSQDTASPGIGELLVGGLLTGAGSGLFEGILGQIPGIGGPIDNNFLPFG